MTLYLFEKLPEKPPKKKKNPYYQKGRRREYKICDDLRKDDYDIVQRSAGSHSPIDVFAIRKRDKKILLVQSKPKSMGEGKKKKLLEDNEWLNGEFNVEFEVI